MPAPPTAPSPFFPRIGGLQFEDFDIRTACQMADRLTMCGVGKDTARPIDSDNRRRMDILRFGAHHNGSHLTMNGRSPVDGGGWSPKFK